MKSSSLDLNVPTTTKALNQAQTEEVEAID